MIIFLTHFVNGIHKFSGQNFVLYMQSSEFQKFKDQIKLKKWTICVLEERSR